MKIIVKQIRISYETDSRNAKKTYKAVVKEYDKMCSLFNNDELEVLTEIN